jgi:hypothetical protein
MKNKQLVIILVVLVIIIGAGGFYFLNHKSAPAQEEETANTQDVVQTLSPEQLGLTITPKSDMKAIKFSISKASGIKSIEYQATYEADSTAEEKGEGGDARVQRGITGDATLEGGKSSYESPWLDLGSCSRNVCRYDKGVESVDLTLKIVKLDGKTYQVEKKTDL